jgi:hypothetical protein
MRCSTRAGIASDTGGRRANARSAACAERSCPTPAPDRAVRGPSRRTRGLTTAGSGGRSDPKSLPSQVIRSPPLARCCDRPSPSPSHSTPGSITVEALALRDGMAAGSEKSNDSPFLQPGIIRPMFWRRKKVGREMFRPYELAVIDALLQKLRPEARAIVAEIEATTHVQRILDDEDVEIWAEKGKSGDPALAAEPGPGPQARERRRERPNGHRPGDDRRGVWPRLRVRLPPIAEEWAWATPSRSSS